MSSRPATIRVGRRTSVCPFADAAPGVAGAETLLALSLNLVRDEHIGITALMRLLSPIQRVYWAWKPAASLRAAYGRHIAGRMPVDGDATRWPRRRGNTPFDKMPVQGRVRHLMKGGVFYRWAGACKAPIRERFRSAHREQRGRLNLARAQRTGAASAPQTHEARAACCADRATHAVRTSAIAKTGNCDAVEIGAVHIGLTDNLQEKAKLLITAHIVVPCCSGSLRC